MELKKMIGLNCTQDSNVKWSKDCQYLIYGCQAIVVAYQINTGEQLCFVGHSEQISCLAINSDNTILASGQTGPYSLIRLWNFKTRKCISILRNHDHSLYLLEFSSCGNYLCGVGRDKQSKSMLVLWDVSKSKNCKIIAKAHTDVHINRLIFIHFDSSRLITCGRDNVRFWRLKNDTLRSCAVNLMPYIHALNMNNGDEHQFLEFTDICMNARPDHNENLAYACTLTGQIFVFNLARMEIEHVRVLEPLIKKTGILNSSKNNHQLRLNSLTISDMFCTTGSDDGYVRIWPLDFSQVSVEAEHEAPIGLVRFSPDCLRIATVTLNGNLGVLDIKNKEYITLIRSHTNSIIDLDYDPKCKYMATASMDGTVRIWSYDNNCRQLYDFSAGNNEIPTCVSFYPKHTDQNDEAIFACGFNSGKIRIFNVSEAKLLKEINSPHFNSNKTSNKYEITDLKYSNEGKRLISGDIMKYLCLYDVDKDYCLIRMLPNSLSIPGSLKISPDSKNVAVIGSNNHLITVFESFNLNELLRIDISINNDSNEILTSLYNNYDRQEIGLKLEYAPYDLNQLLCITASKKLLKFDSKTGRLLSSITNICKSRADSICISNDGKFLVTSGDNVIKIWDYEMRLDKNFQVSLYFKLFYFSMFNFY
jgi:WD40 repeat protein